MRVPFTSAQPFLKSPGSEAASAASEVSAMFCDPRSVPAKTGEAVAMAAAIKSAETAMRIGDPNSARLNGERLAEVPVDAVPISLAVRSRYVGILGRIEPFFAFQFAIELGVRRTD